MRILLKIQALQWVLFAVAARAVGWGYFNYNVSQNSYVNLLFITMVAAISGLWINHILKMKKQIAIRCGDKIARLHASRFILDTFEGKNIQNAFGIDSFNAIAVSRPLFKFLKKISRNRHFDLSEGQVIQKKQGQDHLRYIQFENQFYLIPDSETQIALVGYNGNRPAEKIEKKLVERNSAGELLSVKRWAAYPIKETQIKKEKSAENSNGNGAADIEGVKTNSITVDLTNRIKAITTSAKRIKESILAEKAVEKAVAQNGAGKGIKTTNGALKSKPKAKAKK